MSTISDSPKKSKNSSNSHSEFKLQDKYNSLKKELDSKFEKEGFNNITNLAEDINKLENQLRNPKIEPNCRSTKESKLNYLNQLLNLYNDCKNLQKEVQKEVELEKFNEGMIAYGLSSKDELLLEIDILKERLKNSLNENIKEVNQIIITKLYSLKALLDKIEQPKTKDDKIKEEESKIFHEEKIQKTTCYSVQMKKLYNEKIITSSSEQIIMAKGNEMKFSDIEKDRIQNITWVRESINLHENQLLPLNNSSIHISNIIEIKEKKIDEIPSFDINDLKNLEFLGSGSFGNVYKVYNEKTKMYLAIKYFKEQNFAEISIEDYLLSYVEKINKENRFLKYNGIFKNKDQYFLMMEAGETNLEEILKIRKKYKLNNVLYIFQSLVQDLLYLQKNGIANRDIKSGNIILTKLGAGLFQYKISDFGVACLVNVNHSMKIDIKELSAMSPYYAAPEIKLIEKKLYKEKEYDPFKADVFSLAIVILELLDVSNINEYVTDQKSHTLYEIITKMLKENPSERIGFKEINDELNNLIKNGCISTQPDDEEKFLNDCLAMKKIGKKNDVKILDYLKEFEAYYDIKDYKIAGEKINFCYEEIYLANLNDKNIRNIQIEGLLFYQLARYNHFGTKDLLKAKDFYQKSFENYKKMVLSDSESINSRRIYIDIIENLNNFQLKFS